MLKVSSGTSLPALKIQYVDLLMKTLGPGPSQLHGYCGHQELEIAVLRLYSLTRDERHLDFARYLISERGQKRDDQGGDSYFIWEAKVRRKDTTIRQKIFPSLEDMR